MKYLILISGLLLSCVGSVEDFESTKEVEETENSEWSSGWTRKTNPTESCDYYSYHDFQHPDGTVVHVKIPAECNEYYFDKGDPSPEKNFTDPKDYELEYQDYSYNY